MECDHKNCDGVKMSCIRRHIAEFGGPDRHCKHLVPAIGTNMAERSTSYVLWKRQKDFKGDCIYHYTSIDTLRAMLRPGAKLLCTDFRCLNDTAEFTIGFDCVVATLRKVFGIRGCHEKWIRNQFDVFRSDGVHGPWIMSFTENENDLYQWAAYSDRKMGGCAIGFDFGSMFDFASDIRKGSGLNVDTYWGPCAYLDDEVVFDSFLCGGHREVLTRFASLNAATLRKKDVSVLGDAWSDMMILFALIKHPCFSIEHEWRFIAMPKWTLPVHAFGNIIEKANKRRMSFPFPRTSVRSVLVSPHGDIVSNHAQVLETIQKCARQDIKVIQSELPYRGDYISGQAAAKGVK